MPLRDGCNDCRDSAGLSLGRRQHCPGFYAEKLHLGEKTKVFVVIAKLIICRVVYGCRIAKGVDCISYFISYLNASQFQTHHFF